MILPEGATLEIVLSGAVTANQLPVIIHYQDEKGADHLILSTTNGTTAVSLLTASAPSTIGSGTRKIKYISVYNKDTSTATATVRVAATFGTYELKKAQMSAGDTIEYTETNGWGSATSSTASSGVTSVNGSTGVVVLGGESIAEPVSVLTNSAGTVAINCALGDYFTLALSANVTSFTFSNLPAAGTSQTIMIRITQDATGSRTATWPSSFKWAGGTTGVLSTAASSVDVLALTTFDQGTSWIATLSKAFA